MAFWNAEALKEVALAGGGIACLPLPLVKKRAGKRVSILNAYMKIKFEIILWFFSLKIMPSRCLTFKEFLVKRTLEIKDMVNFSNPN